MTKKFKAIKEIRDDFVSANKQVFTDEKLANKHDFENSISLTAYHNWMLADVVELFYDIHVQNITNLVDEIAITAYNNPSQKNKSIAGIAQKAFEEIINSIDEDFGRFNAMSTQERNGLVSNLAVTFMSPTVIERSRDDILNKTMVADSSYHKDIMNHVKNEDCEHFIDYSKKLNDDFKKKYRWQLGHLYMMKELLVTKTPEVEISNEHEPDEPEVKRTKRNKLQTN